jgi:hypothetical protein
MVAGGPQPDSVGIGQNPFHPSSFFRAPLGGYKGLERLAGFNGADSQDLLSLLDDEAFMLPFPRNLFLGQKWRSNGQTEE